MVSYMCLRSKIWEHNFFHNVMCWRLRENCDKYSGADKNSTQVHNEQ